MGQRRAKNERRERPITSGEIRIEGWGSLSRPRDMEACRRVELTQPPRRVLDRAVHPRRDRDYKLPLPHSRPLYVMFYCARTRLTWETLSRLSPLPPSRTCAYSRSRAEYGRPMPALAERGIFLTIGPSRFPRSRTISKFATYELRKAASTTRARSELPTGPRGIATRAARSRLLAGTSKWGCRDRCDSRERPPPVYTKVTRRSR